MSPAPIRPPLATPAQKFRASNWKHIGKHSLVGSADIATPAGVIYRGVMLHQRDGKRWTQIPSREWLKPDGNKAYVPIIEFAAVEKWQAFNSACLAAIDVLRAEGGGAS
jgi:hypothetical protein